MLMKQEIIIIRQLKEPFLFLPDSLERLSLYELLQACNKCRGKENCTEVNSRLRGVV